MNQLLPRPPRIAAQAAEGMPRWRWTVAEVDRFVELGILTAEDRVELIGGELVPKPAKGIAHEDMRGNLEEWFHARLPRSARVMMELGWRPDESTYCEPDLIVFPRRIRSFSKVPAAEVLLLIEVAESTLKYDLTTKALLYAGLGVREYWVVDAIGHSVIVHRDPGPDGYRRRRRHASGQLLRPHLLPEIALRLDHLDVE